MTVREERFGSVYTAGEKEFGLLWKERIVKRICNEKLLRRGICLKILLYLKDRTTAIRGQNDFFKP